MAVNTDGPTGKAMLTIMAVFAQLKRDTMIARIRAGLAATAPNDRKGRGCLSRVESVQLPHWTRSRLLTSDG
ncbi:recombinase family protein [Nocardia vinacea]|uniref:recombinase family protein n=1 Tax=Nocardia vinacea TaxID=96468 RepID=UPI00343991A8